MGLITAFSALPLAPLRGVVAAAEQVAAQAEDEFYDPVDDPRADRGGRAACAPTARSAKTRPSPGRTSSSSG